jgi:hypothetical protein
MVNFERESKISTIFFTTQLSSEMKCEGASATADEEDECVERVHKRSKLNLVPVQSSNPKRPSIWSRKPHPTASVWISFPSKDNLQQLLKSTKAIFDSTKDPISFDFIIHHQICSHDDFDCLRVAFSTETKSVWSKIKAIIAQDDESTSEKQFTVPLAIFAKTIEHVDASAGLMLWMTHEKDSLFVEAVRPMKSYNREISKIATHTPECTFDFTLPLDYKLTVEFAMNEFKSLINKAQVIKSRYTRLILVRPHDHPEQTYFCWQLTNPETILIEHVFLSCSEQTKDGEVIVFRDQVPNDGETSPQEKLLEEDVDILVDQSFLTEILHKLANNVLCTTLQFQLAPDNPMIITIKFGEDQSYMMFAFPSTEPQDEDPEPDQIRFLH